MTALGKTMDQINAASPTGTRAMSALTGTPPHMLHRRESGDTSVAAAHAVDSSKLEALVLRIVQSWGDHGCTQDNVLQHSDVEGMPYSSVTARFAALIRKGLIEDTGKRRPGRSGRSQRVLRAINN